MAEVLQQMVGDYLRSTADHVRMSLSDEPNIWTHLFLGGPDRLDLKDEPTEHWYYTQVAGTAKQANQRVNFDEHHYFVRAQLRSNQVPWLSFVVSFHHIGQELSGVMEVTAFGELIAQESNDLGYRSESKQPIQYPEC